MKNALVSIIIPIYNIEHYLTCCLNSIVKQTLLEIEIVLIDDGSTDNSGKICDRFASSDIRIRVVHIDHNGLSNARNIGIAISTAPYIMFVDGDDWVEPEFCEQAYFSALDNDADLVLFSFRRIWADGRKKMIGAKYKNGKISEEEALSYNVNTSPAAWTGLYRRRLFDKIQFPVGKLFEDVGTTHKLIHAANIIVYLNKHLYNHRIGRPGSIGTSLHTHSHCDRRDMYICRIEDLYGWGYEEYAKKDILSLFVRFGWKENKQKRYIKIVKKIHFTDFLRLKWKHRIMLVMFKVSPRLFDYVSIKMGKRIIQL